MDRIIFESTKRITQEFKPNSHRAVDLGWRSNEEQNKVYANCEGVVAEIQDGLGNIRGASGTKSWGNYVLIKHPNGMYTRYAHLQSGIPVSKGQSVNEHTVIGIIGNTGNSYGRHLHFEVATGYSSSTRINPTPYLTQPVYAKVEGKIYRTYDNVKNKWLPCVTIGTNDYAGNFGDGVSGLQIEGLRYRVHDKVKNKWLGWITSYNNDDPLNGYAGNLPYDIDGVQIEGVRYRVHIKGQGWLNWIDKVDDTNYGYAGIYGRSIDAIQIAYK